MRSTSLSQLQAKPNLSEHGMCIVGTGNLAPSPLRKVSSAQVLKRNDSELREIKKELGRHLELHQLAKELASRELTEELANRGAS